MLSRSVSAQSGTPSAASDGGPSTRTRAKAKSAPNNDDDVDDDAAPPTEPDSKKKKGKGRASNKRELHRRDPGSPRIAFSEHEVPERANSVQAKVDQGKTLRLANNALQMAREAGESPPYSYFSFTDFYFHSQPIVTLPVSG